MRWLVLWKEKVRSKQRQEAVFCIVIFKTLQESYWKSPRTQNRFELTPVVLPMQKWDCLNFLFSRKLFSLWIGLQVVFFVYFPQLWNQNTYLIVYSTPKSFQRCCFVSFRHGPSASKTVVKTEKHRTAGKWWIKTTVSNHSTKKMPKNNWRNVQQLKKQIYIFRVVNWTTAFDKSIITNLFRTIQQLFKNCYRY